MHSMPETVPATQPPTTGLPTPPVESVEARHTRWLNTLRAAWRVADQHNDMQAVYILGAAITNWGKPSTDEDERRSDYMYATQVLARYQTPVPTARPCPTWCSDTHAGDQHVCWNHTTASFVRVGYEGNAQTGLYQAPEDAEPTVWVLHNDERVSHTLTIDEAEKFALEILGQVFLARHGARHGGGSR